MGFLNQLCSVCNGTIQHWKTIKGFDIYHCVECGVKFVFPYKLEKDVSILYEDNQKSECEYYIRTMLEDAKTFNARLKTMEHYVPEDRRTVLDFGCSIGTFLKCAKDRGWFLLVGYDLNSKALGFIKDEPSIQVNTFLPTIEFDVIHASDVIEHVPDPRGLLLSFNGQLRKGGKVFLTTPNAGSWLAMLLGKRWHAFKPPEHLFYFNKSSMNKLAYESGFKVLKVDWSWRYRRIGTVIEHLSAVSKMGKFLKRITPNVIKNIIIPFSVGDELFVVLEKC